MGGASTGSQPANGTHGGFQCDTLLIDLDDCLYQIEDVPKLMLERIQAYMTDKLAIPRERVPELSQHYYLNYGTTLAGLVADGHKIDFDDWHAHVHGSLPYERLFPGPDPAMRAWLESVTLPKYLFTNSDEAHAHLCLRLMGVDDLFDGVITFERIQQAAAEAGLVHRGVPVVCKPHRQAFELALRLAGGAKASTTMFLDDSTRNVAGGRAVGMFTVLVGRVGVGSEANAEVRSLLDIPKVMPWLWQQLTAPHHAASTSSSGDMRSQAAAERTTGAATPAGASSVDAAVRPLGHMNADSNSSSNSMAKPVQQQQHLKRTGRPDDQGVASQAPATVTVPA